MMIAATTRPISEANCPLRRAIMQPSPRRSHADEGAHFQRNLVMLAAATGLATVLVFENLGTLNYVWLLIMELCT